MMGFTGRTVARSFPGRRGGGVGGPGPVPGVLKGPLMSEGGIQEGGVGGVHGRHDGPRLVT